MGANYTDNGKGLNPHFNQLTRDVLFHFGLDTVTHDFKKMFGDIKFVCMGGSSNRMKHLAEELALELDITLLTGQGLVNITASSDRYAMYKVGPVLSVSHGMGIPSISILLHEVIKLVSHAECKDVTFFRVGTAGGLGVEPGTIVISDACVDGLFRPYLEMHILGEVVQRPAVLDKGLATELHEMVKSMRNLPVIRGKTMCCNDFYEGQARLDGAICHYSEPQKKAFLQRAHDMGVRNIEMESLCFAAFCHELGIKGAVLTVILIDRFKSDQLAADKTTVSEWELRLGKILGEYVKRSLKQN